MKTLFALVVMLGFVGPAFAGTHCRQWCDANGSGRCDIYCDNN
jgi:hypothetical protein